HGLLNNKVAGHPIIIEPIAQLEFEVRPPRLAGFQTQVATVPERRQRQHVTDCPFAYAPKNSPIGIGIAKTEARNHREVLRLRFTYGFKYPADARWIDSNRFLTEYVFIRIHRSLQVQRPEHRRRSQQDDVYSGVDNLLISVEPYV